MKKLTAIFLLTVLILTLCACGKGEGNVSDQSIPQSSTQNTASENDEIVSTDTVTSDAETAEGGDTQSTESADSSTLPSETVSSSKTEVSSKEQTSSKTDTSSKNQISSKNEITSRPEVSNQVHIALKESEYYQYSNMTADQKKVYLRLKTAAVSYQNSVDVSDLDFTVNEAVALIRCFAADHPQYFWISNHVSATYNPATNKATACVMLYSDGTVTDDVKTGKKADRTKINSRKTEVEAKVKEIVSRIGTDWSDYDKEKYIHDYLVDTIKYNQKVAENPITNGNVHQALDAYGALIGKSAVCEGYAKAFQYLCYTVGINANQVHGPGHEWNVVKLDGEWYQIDVTWDDPIVSGGGDMKTYDFFNLTTKQMLAKDHSIDPNSPLTVPSCTATKNKYKK